MPTSINDAWQRFDRLLKGMTQGEPHKAEKRAEKKPRPEKSEE